MDNYYTILGVPEAASQDEIKKAYRKLASIHHPDKGGDTAKFQSIQAAYDNLSDEAKRSRYDNSRNLHSKYKFDDFGHGGFSKSDFDKDEMFEDLLNKFKAGRGFDDWNTYNDPFDSIRRRQNQQPRKNKDIKIDMTVTLAETLSLQKRTVNVRGTGATQTVQVEIPMGAHNGATIKYPGLGDDMFKTLPRGDLYVTIHVDPSNKFMVDGVNLVAAIDIDCLRAIIGCEQEFTTLDNKTFLLTVPPGTQQGTKFKVSGQGLWNTNFPTRGDLILVANVKVPTNLSQSQLDNIRQLLNT